MALVRYRTERSFDAALNLVRGIACAPVSSTGNAISFGFDYFGAGKGWMTIAIQRVLSSGQGFFLYCDITSPCDPYVKIFVNGITVRETVWQDDAKVAMFMETYTTEKINHDDEIRLEVWDRDNWQSGGDDLMLCVVVTADNYKTNQRDGKGDVILESNFVWKPDYSPITVNGV